MAQALRHLPEFSYCRVAVLTSNKAALLTFRHPRQESGQAFVRCAYDSIEALEESRNFSAILWHPVGDENELLRIGKEEARKATHESAIPERQCTRMRSTSVLLVSTLGSE